MKKVSILLFLTVMFSCNQENSVGDFLLEQSDQLTDEEYEVYAVILENYSGSQHIVRQQTSTQTPNEDAFALFFNLEKMSNMEETLFSRYAEDNVSSVLLDERIEVPTKDVKLISNEEYTYYFQRDDPNKSWSLFQKKYPSAGAWFFSVNKIGFNESKTQALVGVESYWYMESPDGPTLNSGTLHYLEKKDGVWQSVGSSVYAL